MWGHENGDGEKRELTFQRQMGEESLMVELLVCQWQKGNTGNKRAEISAMLSFFSSPDLRRTKNKRKAEEQVRIIRVGAPLQYCTHETPLGKNLHWNVPPTANVPSLNLSSIILGCNFMTICIRDVSQKNPKKCGYPPPVWEPHVCEKKNYGLFCILGH